MSRLNDLLILLRLISNSYPCWLWYNCLCCDDCLGGQIIRTVQCWLYCVHIQTSSS